ncbi:primosomal protein N' [Streptococcus pluranimalium]|uniref:primosomal protein N' n=1 Tax=Streptococcus pluranimalium TaxID=82348 RepID=UPI0039FC85EF
MQAQIIVDVPLMQTDKPFTYSVPEMFEELIQVGSRVHVPFGRGNRLLQGFVVSLENNADPKDLKSIVDLLDLEPVLNPEQLRLADDMRKTVFSYKITLLKSMIPSLLNSQYDKRLQPSEGLSHRDKETIFGRCESLSYSDIPENKRKQVNRLIAAKLIRVDYVARDKKKVKTEKFLDLDKSALAGLEVSNRAKKRQEAKVWLLSQDDSFSIKSGDLNKQYSRDVVNYFIQEGALIERQEEVQRSAAYFESVESSHFLALNYQQTQAVDAISKAIDQEEAKPFLLEGITGSGKTEVYLHVIDRVLKMGKTAIVLVPEISLTPQMTNRFISRFGEQVAIMHSGLSDGEKFDEWRKIKSGQAKVVVGARSAIFVPLDNIGAIIIDEEHEATYKQESNPRYHARDVALLRAKTHKAALVLGSATPAIETRARASKGVYYFLELTERANPNASIPRVEVVDFRDYIGQQETSNFTPSLLEKIQEKLAKQEQVVLMLNRRGYSSFVMCRECGYVDECPNCDISLTLHMDTKTMNCHYCDFQKVIPWECPSCQSRSIRYYGTGTQKAFDELQELLPEARILRMDVDTTRRKGAHESLLKAFGNHEADILLGTQMIAKGLDFPNVTLVGVLNADTSLNLPDFRASERTFQLLTQVAGRAGRADKAGEVLVQTYNPDHYAIRFAQKQDFEGFYAYEMKIRQKMGYPPYYYTVGITLSHQEEQEVVRKAYDVLKGLKGHLSEHARFLGPTPKPIARTHNTFHYQIIIKYRFEEQLETALNALLEWTQKPENKELRVTIDNEPQNMM